MAGTRKQQKRRKDRAKGIPTRPSSGKSYYGSKASAEAQRRFDDRHDFGPRDWGSKPSFGFPSSSF